MSSKKDYTEDLEFIKSISGAENIKAPESLSEDRIAAILPDRSEVTDPELEALLAEPAVLTVEAAKSSAHEDAAGSSASNDASGSSSAKRTPLRKWFAVAACLIVAVIGGIKVYDLATAPPDTSVADGELYIFKNQSEISNLVSSLDPGYDLSSNYGDDLELLDGDAILETEDSAPMASGSAKGSADAGDRMMSISSTAEAGHSDTYLQVEEVDESDIVKTDGKYIYYVSEDREVVILRADNGKTKKVSTIGSQDVENYIHEIYIKGDTLITVGAIYEGDEGSTGIVTYDISDRSKPEMLAVYRQTGEIISSRMVGDYIYLVTSEYVYKGGRIVPKCMTDGKFTEMQADSICCTPNPVQASYIVLGAMDITSGKEAKCRTKAIFGASEDIYCNDHNLYTASSEWSPESPMPYTRIVRAALDGLDIRFNATAKVRGYIDNQFSMDEKDGYFRIATTATRDGIDVNNLFVFDSDLKETGSVTGFARNESIKAVRYLGDKAYVITYEAIDPLFIIDLSDPAAPRIEGEVKIDGFSSLLIPAGDGRLLGIGYATGDNGYGGEYSAGLKLALFDISDPSEPKVLDSKEFKDMDSPAQETHKALIVNARDGWYAVPYWVYNYEEDIITEGVNEGDEESADEEPAVTVKEEGGVLVFGADDELSVYDQHKLGTMYMNRCVYIGDYIYALDNEGDVSSFRFAK